MMRKLLSTMLILCLVLTSLGSIGALAENKELAPAKVNIYQYKVEIADALEKAIKRYMELNPQVSINLETVGGGDDYTGTLKAKMQSGEPATIFNIGGPADVNDWLSKLENLSDQPWVKEAVPGTLGGVTLDEKVYGMPVGIEGYGFVINKRIFEAAGVETDGLTGFDAIEQAFLDLQAKIDAGELKEQFPLLESVFEVPGKETWIQGRHTLNVAMNQEIPSLIAAFEAKTIKLKHSAEYKLIIDLMSDLTVHKDNKSFLNAIDYDTQVGGGLAIERVAAIQQGNWIYGDVKNVDPEVAAALDILPIALKGVVEDSIPVGVPKSWAVNKDAPDADKAAAKDFLNWLYQSEEGKKIVIDEFFFIPPFVNYEGLEPHDPLALAVMRFAQAGKTTPWVFGGFPSGWDKNVMGGGIQKYFAGEATWDEIVQEAIKTFEEARAK